MRLWEHAWAEFVPFVQFDVEIRKIVCTTNAIESVNARIRKAVRARGHFPTEQAALECVYLAVMSLDPTGTGAKRWTGDGSRHSRPSVSPSKAGSPQRSSNNQPLSYTTRCTDPPPSTTATTGWQTKYTKHATPAQTERGRNEPRKMSQNVTYSGLRAGHVDATPLCGSWSHRSHAAWTHLTTGRSLICKKRPGPAARCARASTWTVVVAGPAPASDTVFLYGVP